MSLNTFTHALLRYPTPNFGNGLTTQQLGAPAFSRAMQQYSAYLDALRACGLAVTTLPGDPAYPDGCFVEDTAIMFRDMVMITQPGAASRLGESASIAEALQSHNLVHMTAEGRMDGGDVLFCADRVLIGISQRTNQEGANQLRNALMDYDSSLKIDFVPFGGVLHLKTGVTELAPGVLLRSPMMTTDYPFDFAENDYLPHAEAHGANVLPINNAIMIMTGYPTVAELAENHYTNIVELPMSEFEKMDGSLTCLSLRYVNR
jgi:dimethylargininase